MAKPSHNVYVNAGGEDSKHKIKVGAIFMHQNGEGFNIVLNANPLDGRLVAFPLSEDTNDNKKKDT